MAALEISSELFKKSHAAPSEVSGLISNKNILPGPNGRGGVSLFDKCRDKPHIAEWESQTIVRTVQIRMNMKLLWDEQRATLIE